MLTTRSDRAGTPRPTGSLSTGAPGGTVTDDRPPNVSVRSLPAAIRSGAPSTAARATWAAPIPSGRLPNSFDSRTRTTSPPMLTWTSCRIVWFSNVATFVGGTVVGTVAQVPTQVAGVWAAEAAAGTA